MNNTETVLFLEQAYNRLEQAEGELKNLTNTISRSNQEIRALRAFRDEAESERNKLLEELKVLSIDLEAIGTQNKDEPTSQD